ncbi:MAG: hypothetical protein ABUL60_28540 [Myxococcales bacterium]
MTKKWLIVPVFGLALIANPYLGCSHSDENGYSYSEADMKRAVLGSWEGNADIDGESVEFSLVLEQASAKSKTQSISAPKAQPQCSSRSFVKPAAACWVTTSMPVSGTITSVNPALNGAVDGVVTAGADLDPAELSLRLEDGTQLSGAFKKQALSDGHVTKPQQIGTFSLSRP